MSTLYNILKTFDELFNAFIYCGVRSPKNPLWGFALLFCCYSPCCFNRHCMERNKKCYLLLLRCFFIPISLFTFVFIFFYYLFPEAESRHGPEIFQLPHENRFHYYRRWIHSIEYVQSYTTMERVVHYRNTDLNERCVLC